MDEFGRWIVGISGLYFLMFGLILNTHNFKSAMAFKFFPVVMGFGCILVSLHMFGIF